ncbi:MAG: tRNA (adenosine(37)-N6)-dimethylallyltransferase MiaA [Bacteroidales bacterium]|nr:tRNA (adenosine(37)-N6)-dimethylallyltransferase MiaA [Bacteroidales bacterium]
MTVFVLLGPTAVGKTALSLQMAELLGVPIINCDSRQIYREIPICTAAPTAEEQARVQHFFVGTHSLEDAYSAAQYEIDVMRLFASCPRDYLLSGGSMMYIDAVTKGIDDMPQADPAIRERLRSQYEAEGLQPLLLQLQQLDPVYFVSVDRQNPQRVIHGLEMCLTTGQPYSTFHTGRSKERPFNIVKIGLRRDREELYRRIDLRVEQMFQQGIVEEARRVYLCYQSSVDEQFTSVVRNPGPTQKQPIPNLIPPALNTVGLKELLLYFTGVYSLDRAKERISHNSKVYSKKQMTWFQRDQEIHWFHPDDADKILQFVRNFR